MTPNRPPTATTRRHEARRLRAGPASAERSSASHRCRVGLALAAGVAPAEGGPYLRISRGDGFARRDQDTPKSARGETGGTEVPSILQDFAGVEEPKVSRTVDARRPIAGRPTSVGESRGAPRCQATRAPGGRALLAAGGRLRQRSRRRELKRASRSRAGRRFRRPTCRTRAAFAIASASGLRQHR
jgi:hypothetical protein